MVFCSKSWLGDTSSGGILTAIFPLSIFFVLLQLALEDPVHSVSLQQFVYEKLKAQQALMGDQGFGALMETVDTELVRQLQEFLQGLWIYSPSTPYTNILLPLFPHFWKCTGKANNLPDVWTPNPDLPNLYPCYALSIFRPSLVDCPQLTPLVPSSIIWIPYILFYQGGVYVGT